MNLCKGNIWSMYSRTDLLVITINGVVVNDQLVMGAWVAREARERWPTLPYFMGMLLKEKGEFSRGAYRLPFAVLDRWYEDKLATLQTKYHWQDRSDIDLIQNGLDKLTSWVHANPQAERVDMVFPGIGNGGLRRDDVLFLLMALPKNVHVWEKQ